MFASSCPSLQRRGKDGTETVNERLKIYRNDGFWLFSYQWASWSLHGLTAPAKHEQVHAAVQEKHKKTEGHLKLSGQPCGVKKGQDVVLDKP